MTKNESNNTEAKTMTKTTKAELTKAIARFARRHGYYADMVRGDSRMRQQAIEEYAAKTSGPTEWSKSFHKSEAR